MAVKLWSNRIEQFVDGTGVPRSGAKLFTYVGGSVNTKQTTYTESTGSTPNTNPIVLDSSGRIPQPIWLTTGVSYKFVLAPPTDTDPPTSPIDTLDVITGINDSTSAQSEWVAGPAPTFVSATQFTLVGDQTTNFHLGRRVKATVTAGTSYGTITASAFGAVTTVTVDTTGANPIDSGLSAIAYGLLSAANFSQSLGLDAVTRTGTAIASATTTNLNAAGGDNVHVTGVTTITAITLAQGHERTVVFDGALTLTNGASLILPGAANILTAAGDTAIFRGEASSVVRCTQFTSAVGGVLGKGIADISSSGAGQIKFPATQNPSSDVNTLDDYEEGLWTPSVGGSATYSLQIGRYVKIGKLVTIIVRIAITSLGTGSATTISGLPFAAANLGMDQAGAVSHWASIASGKTFVSAYVVDNSSVINFSSRDTAATASTNGDGILGSGADVTFSITYQATA